jgi:uncharacterized RDD family membrane protein YckC
MPGRIRYFSAAHTDRIRNLDGLPLASFGRRGVAYALDWLISFPVLAAITALTMVTAKAFPALAEHFGEKDAKGDLTINILHTPFGALFLLLYFGLSLYWGNGRTLGKRIMKIRVVSLSHNHLSFWHAMERALGYATSLLEFGFGFIQYFLSPNGQTVHDRLAGTIVIDERAARMPVLPAHADQGDADQDQSQAD